jgi:hypothetical protein
MSEPVSPSHRPTWVLVLSCAMMLHGGFTLVGGLLTVRDPKAVVAVAARSAARGSVEADLADRLIAVDESVLDRHLGGVRATAGAGIVFGLYTLYAVAAILSRDRRGRTLALGVAALGLVNQLAALPLAIRMAREVAAASAPILAGMVEKGATAADLARELESKSTRPPIVLTAFSLLWCGIIVRFFGGRNGRKLYGLEPRGPLPPV